MNLQHYYYYFQSAIPARICDDIIRYGKQLQDHIALTGRAQKKPLRSKKDMLDLKKKRNSDIVWLDEKWIYKEIQSYVHQANKAAGWNFQWDWSENCQFTKYTKGQFYGWHCDSWGGVYNDAQNPQNPTNGKVRKLSVTCCLSDPKDYKGGELEFDFRNTDPDQKPNIQKCNAITSKGSIVVFPSDVWHRVCPVKKGTRYSLVVWNLGWPFK